MIGSGARPSLPLAGPLAVFGAGHMAEALLGGIVAKGVFRAADVRISDAIPEKSLSLAQRLGAASASGNADAARGARVCLLAVKPHDVPAVLREIRDAPPADRLLISIAAGVTTRAMERMLGGHPRVVRAMPNTPALVGKGMSVICRGAHATDDDLQLAEAMLASVGGVRRADETRMDAVTAISGSGPAYVFYLAEILERTAVSLGLDGDAARDLVSSTIEGAAVMMRETGLPPEELRRRVTSKRGTTEEALNHLESAHTRDVWAEAIRKACQRAAEIARESEPKS